MKQLLVLAAALVSLTGCLMFPAGPDLAKAPSPFGDTARIKLADPDKVEGNSLPGGEIVHSPDGDTTVITIGDGKTQTYEAALTWRAFDPGAEFSAKHDYWLMGANIFRTPDRSYYGILRLPKNAQYVPGSVTDGEVLMISCMALASVREKPKKPADPAAEPDFSSMAGCDFNSLDEVLVAAPKLVAAAKEAAAKPAEPEDEVDTEDLWASSGDSDPMGAEWGKLRITIP